MADLGSPKALRFGTDYSSAERLADGTMVHLRLIGPKDRDKLRAGFERLSPASRYRRFLAPTPRLTGATLRRLTDTDGWNHFAIGAETVTDDSAASQGLGVARFFRLRDRPDVAEAAVAVIDEAQGRGIGRLLLARLVEAARERDIRWFRAYLSPDNEPAKRLIQDLAPGGKARVEGGLLVYEIELPAQEKIEIASTPLYRLLKEAAGGIEVVLRRLTQRRK